MCNLFYWQSFCSVFLFCLAPFPLSHTSHPMSSNRVASFFGMLVQPVINAYTHMYTAFAGGGHCAAKTGSILYSLVCILLCYLAILCENPSKSSVELQLILVNSCIKFHCAATPYSPAVPRAVPEPARTGSWESIVNFSGIS